MKSTHLYFFGKIVSEKVKVREIEDFFLENKY